MVAGLGWWVNLRKNDPTATDGKRPYTTPSMTNLYSRMNIPNLIFMVGRKEHYLHSWRYMSHIYAYCLNLRLLGLYMGTSGGSSRSGGTAYSPSRANSSKFRLETPQPA